MKRLTAFALVAFFCVPATAQQPTSPGQSIEHELLEMEQDVDKTILREALMLQGRRSMKTTPDALPEKKLFDEETAALRGFIASKKDAIIARAAELTKSRAASRRVTTATTVSSANQPANLDRQAAYEKYADAEVEVQLLQAQLNLLQPSLDQAVQTLATAELTASNDDTQRGKAEAARKEYERVKAKYVEHNKRLHVEQQKVQSMQVFGMGGMGGGMR